MSIDLSSLNNSQRDAVNWQQGPLLVIAGPGSGKTRVLTYRIARLISETPDARFRVLGITFTNKAASEMKSRIDSLLPEGRDRALLTTFHSFAADILRQHGSHVGLKPDFAILSEQADREAVLTDAIKATIPADSEFEPSASQIIPAINRMLDECLAPAQAEAHLGNQPHAHELAGIYRAYRSRLISANQLDFGSLLAIAVELLEGIPAVAKQVRRVYSYVCVDEFQDTNASQHRLLVQLVSESTPNLFVVADGDQLIYQWNGANPQRMRELQSRFNMQVLQLPENYRCPADVIALANKLIAHNSDRDAGKQPLSAHKAAGVAANVSLNKFADFDSEKRWIARKILALPASERQRSVILARRKKLLDEAVLSLEDAGVPAYIANRKNEFQSTPFRWLHSLLRLANARQDREQLRRLSRAFFQLEGINLEVEDIAARAAVNSMDLLTTWIDVAGERSGLSAPTRALLVALKDQLLNRMDYWSAVKLSIGWFDKIKGEPVVDDEKVFDEFADELAIWNALVADIGTHYTLADLSLHNFLQELDLRAKEKPAPPDAVRCMTIHASKGMEFKHVFLIGLVEDELPSWAAVKKASDSSEMREERRGCFVALTRAEETLNLTYSARYFGYSKSPSRFLKEMGFAI